MEWKWKENGNNLEILWKENGNFTTILSLPYLTMSSVDISRVDTSAFMVLNTLTCSIQYYM